MRSSALQRIVSALHLSRWFFQLWYLLISTDCGRSQHLMGKHSAPWTGTRPQFAADWRYFCCARWLSIFRRVVLSQPKYQIPRQRAGVFCPLLCDGCYKPVWLGMLWRVSRYPERAQTTVWRIYAVKNRPTIRKFSQMNMFFKTSDWLLAFRWLLFCDRTQNTPVNFYAYMKRKMCMKVR